MKKISGIISKTINLIKKIIVWTALIFSIPFLFVAVADYFTTHDSLDIFIFVFFLFIFLASLKYIIKNRKRAIEQKMKSHEQAAIDTLNREYQETLEEMGEIYLNLFNKQYYVKVNLLNSKQTHDGFEFLMSADTPGQIEYLFSKQDVMNLNIKNYYHEFEKVYDDKFVLRLTNPQSNVPEISDKNDIPEETRKSDRLSMYHNKFDYMEGHDFEQYCSEILLKNNFTNVEVTKGSGDQGIDILAYKDGVKYGIQCKCYSSDVGNKAVQEAFSGAKFYECHVPVVITNSFFTKSAIELAEKTHVILWDRKKLESMINEAGMLE